MASENNTNHIDKEWDTLWNELDSIKKPAGFHKDTGSFTQTKNFKLKDYGIGAMMIAGFANPIQGFQAQLRSGAGHIEFSPGAMGGSQGTDFGKIGKERRQALKDLAKINKATIHTHAHPGITGMSGWDPQRGFSEETVEFGLQEVKKAIEFAADIEQGGPITLHAGEFMRPLQSQDFGEEFNMSKQELDKLELYLVDKEKKQVMGDRRIQVGQRVTATEQDYDEPEIKIAELGEIGTKFYKAKKDGEKVLTHEFDNFKQYTAFLINKDKQFQKQAKDKDIDISKYIKEDYKTEDKYEVTDFGLLELAAKFKTQTDMKNNISQQAGQAFYQARRQVNEIRKIYDAVNDAKKEVEKDPSKKMYIKKELRGFGSAKAVNEEGKARLKAQGFDDDDFITVQKGVNINDEEIETLMGEYKIGNLDNEKALAQAKQIQTKNEFREYIRKIEDIDTASDFAQKTAAKNYAELALEAYDKTKIMKKHNPNATDIHLAIENLFPERYGSHPAELLNVIKDARKAFQNELVQRKGMTESEANKVAQNTIKATFDTGHLNMWKKHFRFKDDETPEERDEKFQKWALKQTEELVNAGVIGNIHMADNFGYADDHLSVGQGNVPIKEYMELFDKAKGEGKITGKIAVEGGFDEGQNGVHEAWKQTGVQVFRSQAATDAWVNPESSQGSSYGYHQQHNNYLGNYNKPAFIFGKYSPDQNEWAPWSETTLE